jgi:hypothetical protein
VDIRGCGSWLVISDYESNIWAYMRISKSNTRKMGYNCINGYVTESINQNIGPSWTLQNHISKGLKGQKMYYNANTDASY